MKYLKVYSRDSAVLCPEKLFIDVSSAPLFQIIEKLSLCFTRSIYLSPKARITHDLLHYAYRRTAALRVQEGREGIDWIIPLRVGTEKEEFIGLVGQDKNRITDELEQLTKVDNSVTRNNLNPLVLLKKEERATLPSGWHEVRWPSILFAVDVEEPGVALAEAHKQFIMPSKSTTTSRGFKKRKLTTSEGTQSGDTRNTTGIPCIVLAGLDYDFLSPKERNPWSFENEKVMSATKL